MEKMLLLESGGTGESWGEARAKRCGLNSCCAALCPSAPVLAVPGGMCIARECLTGKGDP